MLKGHIIVVMLWGLACVAGIGQDIHYSQFFNHFPGQNPSHTGAYWGDHRITSIYRSQWQTVPVPYLSLSLFYDSKIKVRGKRDFIGLGIGLDYDQAGDSRLSLTSLTGMFSYGINFTKNHQLRIGVNPNIGQRRFSEEKLKWDNQWDGEKFNSQLSPKETFGITGSFFFDMGAGASYQYTKTKRSYLSIGASWNHLLSPNQSFYTSSITKVELPIRSVYHASVSIGILPFIDLLAYAQIQQQDVYEETAASGMFRLYLDKNPGVKLNLLLGAGLRMEDAFYPLAGFQYKNWTALASYDINTSDFRTASNKRGGLEVSLQYLFKSVEPIGIFKKCPIY